MKVKLLSKKNRKKAGTWTPSSRWSLPLPTGGGHGGVHTQSSSGAQNDELLAVTPKAAVLPGVSVDLNAAAAESNNAHIHSTVEATAAVERSPQKNPPCEQEDDVRPETPAGRSSLGERTAATADVTVLERSADGCAAVEDGDGSDARHIELKLTDAEDENGCSDGRTPTKSGLSYRCSAMGEQPSRDPIPTPSIEEKSSEPVPQCRTLPCGTDAKRDGGGEWKEDQRSRSSLRSGGNRSGKTSKASSRQSSQSGGGSDGRTKSRRRRRRSQEVKMTEEEKDEEIDRLQAENNALAEEVRSMSLRACIDGMKHERREHEYAAVVKKLVRKGEERNEDLARRCKDLEGQLMEKDQIIEELRARLEQLESSNG